DVLDDLAAGLERLAAACRGAKAEEVIARGAGRHASRAGEIRGEHAADRLAALAAQQRSEIGRLERQPLSVRMKRALDRREWRRGVRSQHELSRLVRDYPFERAEVVQLRVDGSSDLPLRAGANGL